MQPLLHFLEKPVTADEKEIAALLYAITQAFKNKDIELLGSIYTDDALIQSLRRKQPFPKADYLEEMKTTMQQVRKVAFHDILIRIYNEKKSTVSCISNTFLKTLSNPKRSRREFSFEKRDAKWYIYKADYIF